MISRYFLVLILFSTANMYPMAQYKRKADQELSLLESPAKKLVTLTQEELNAALFDAAQRGDRDEMVLLLDAGANSDILHGDETPLIRAMIENHLRCVQLLIERGATRTLGTPIAATWNYNGQPPNESIVYVANKYLDPSPDYITLVCNGNREYIMPKSFTKLSRTLTDLLDASPDTKHIEVPVDQDPLINLMGHIQKIIMLTIVMEHEEAVDYGDFQFDLADDFMRDHTVTELIEMLKVANFLGITIVVDYVLPRAIAKKHVLEFTEQLDEARLNGSLISEIMELIRCVI